MKNEDLELQTTLDQTNEHPALIGSSSEETHSTGQCHAPDNRIIHICMSPKIDPTQGKKGSHPNEEVTMLQVASDWSIKIT